MVALTLSDARAAGFEGLAWLFGLLMLVSLAAVIALYFRRRLRSNGLDSGGFSLAELRRLRNRGELTVPEYEALRDRMLRRQPDSSRPGA